MNVPKLRFKEFNDNWNIDTLGNLGEFKNGINKGKEAFGFGIPFVNLLNVFNKNHISNTKNLNLVNASNSEILEYSLEKGDVLFVRSSVKTSGVGLTCLIDETLKNTVYSGFLIRFRENKNKIVNIYKKYYFYNSFFRNALIKKSTKSANININQDNLSLLNVSFPSEKEQEKIGTFLSLLDKKIELQSKKIEALKLYKKGLYKLYFSSNSRNFKEIPLKNICEITTGKLDANAMVKNGKYRFYTCAKDYYYIDEYAFDTEALLISGNGAYVGYIHYYKGKFNAYQRTYVLTNFKYNIKYIKCYLECFLSKRINSEKKEGNTPYIVMGTLSNMNIKLPSKEEQERISSNFDLLTDKINLEEIKLNKLEALKKGLMQNMFV